MITIQELTSYVESLFPTAIQESFDNSGLQTGRTSDKIKGVLVCLDVSDSVLQEAKSKGFNVIISHHPLIFSGLKKLTGSSDVERKIEFAIRNDIALYALHTNADKQFPGLNKFVGEKMGLQHIEVLSPEIDQLKKLVTFCPADYAEQVRKAIFHAGAGVIGEYESCSFNMEGIGTFKGSDNTDPFSGEPGKLHYAEEIRIETIFPFYLEKKVLKALFESHPYEEVAFDIYKLENENPVSGMGVTGFLKQPLNQSEFLKFVKSFFNLSVLKYSGTHAEKISKISFCGGSGSSLTHRAVQVKSDAFITGDLKYHDFEKGFPGFLLIDAGHYETEIFFKEYIVNLLMKKFTNFAIQFSESEKNHVNYF